jgi:hypothetical protein
MRLVKRPHRVMRILCLKLGQPQIQLPVQRLTQALHPLQVAPPGRHAGLQPAQTIPPDAFLLLQTSGAADTGPTEQRTGLQLLRLRP